MRFFKLALTTLVSFLVFFSLFEFFSRIYEVNRKIPEIRVTTASSTLHKIVPFLVFRFKNNISGNQYDTNFTINSLGFRGKDISINKPEGTYRIIALGDSCTFGYGVSDDMSTFPFLLEKKLNAIYKNIEVINAGVPSYYSLQSLVWFVTELMEFDPDLVVVNLGWNDIGNMFTPGQSAEYGIESIFVGEGEFPIIKKKKSFLRSLLNESAGFRMINKWAHKITKHFNPEFNDELILRQDENMRLSGIKAYQEFPYFMQRLFRIFKRCLTGIVAVSKNGGADIILIKPSFIINEKSDKAFIEKLAKHFGRDVFIKERNSPYGKIRLSLNNKMYEIIEEVAKETDSYIFDATNIFPQDETSFLYFSDYYHLSDEGTLHFVELLKNYIIANNIIKGDASISK